MLTEIRPQEIFIKIKNKFYGLRFDFEAFANIEQILGSIKDAFELLNKLDIAAVKTFLWAGLLHNKESLPLKKFADMSIDDGVIKVLSDALNESLGDGYSFFDEWDWSLLNYVGTVHLGMDESDFWKSTPRKILALMKIDAEAKNMNLSEDEDLSGDKAVEQFMKW